MQLCVNFHHDIRIGCYRFDIKFDIFLVTIVFTVMISSLDQMWIVTVGRSGLLSVKMLSVPRLGDQCRTTAGATLPNFNVPWPGPGPGPPPVHATPR
jgi:hypothetical protein